MEHLSWLIIVLPLLGFVLNISLGRKWNESRIALVGSLAVLLPFVLSIVLFAQFISTGNSAPIRFIYWEWMSVGSFSVNYSVQLDQLSLLMMLVITGIGFLIHVYSAGYMHGDSGYARFFAYLNLFVFFMLILVMGSNYLLMFIGWEGVGLCSYLLIGFWYKNQAYSAAANKAFIMNRIGDLGLLLGLFLLVFRFSSLEYRQIQYMAMNDIDIINDPYIVNATILLFIGAIGKSAQIPLFTWLPDAMAGPTPVSALIHAATMVTAGIYLIIRSNVLFSLAPLTQEIILMVGLITALLAASIGLKQNDIKKVLAYSTVSQLGYMFFALGLGAYTAAFFHLFTHAFFKALLFLGSGSVIHAMGGEQDIRKMGGLAKFLPATKTTFLIGTLAIAGIPPLSGFFSKDQILASAFGAGREVLWGLMLFGALMTAYYMFRLYFLVFAGSFRGTAEQKAHLHESPKSMTLPLVVLAFFAVIAGFFNIPEALGGTPWLDRFFEPLLSGTIAIQGKIPHLSHTLEYILMAVSVLAIVVVIYAAYVRYVRHEHLPEEDQLVKSPIQRLLLHKYYFDEIYHVLITKPVNAISSFFEKVLEPRLFTGIIQATSWSADVLGTVLRRMQSGQVGIYVFIMVLGVIAILMAEIFKLYFN